MSDYWQNLTLRERTLASVAGVLTLLLLGYFAVVRPLALFAQDSEWALARALTLHGQIVAAAREVETLRAQRGSTDGVHDDTSVRVAVAQQARAHGVAISRLQPGEDGALTVWVESTQSQAFYSWVHSLADEHGIALTKVIVQKSTSLGRLRVQLELVGV